MKTATALVRSRATRVKCREHSKLGPGGRSKGIG